MWCPYGSIAAHISWMLRAQTAKSEGRETSSARPWLTILESPSKTPCAKAADKAGLYIFISSVQNFPSASKELWSAKAEPWQSWRISCRERPSSPRGPAEVLKGRGPRSSAPSAATRGHHLASEKISQGEPASVAATLPSHTAQPGDSRSRSNS